MYRVLSSGKLTLSRERKAREALEAKAQRALQRKAALLQQHIEELRRKGVQVKHPRGAARSPWPASPTCCCPG